MVGREDGLYERNVEVQAAQRATAAIHRTVERFVGAYTEKDAGTPRYESRPGCQGKARYVRWANESADMGTRISLREESVIAQVRPKPPALRRARSEEQRADDRIDGDRRAFSVGAGEADRYGRTGARKGQRCGMGLVFVAQSPALPAGRDSGAECCGRR